MYGGRMRLVNRRRSPSWSVRRSFTRGALTGMVPEPIVTFRVRPLPLRTTRACPSSSRSSRCASRYAATSASSAATSIRRAPSRAISSSRDRPSTSSCAVSLPTTFSMGAASFPPRGRRRRSIRREDTPPGSWAPRSTTFGHTSGAGRLIARRAAPSAWPHLLYLPEEFGDAVQRDLGGGGVSLRRFAAGGGCSLPVVLTRLPWAVDAQCNQHASCRGRRWSRAQFDRRPAPITPPAARTLS